MLRYVERAAKAVAGITVSVATLAGVLAGGVVGGVALGGAAAPPAAAVQVEQDRVVSPVPAAFTPAVAGGRVSAIAQVGDRMVLGGSFSEVTDEAGVTHQRTKIMSMDAATGRVDTAFAPSLDGKVEALLPGPTPETVYAGGGFATVNGVTQRRLALLDLRTGESVPTFRTPAFNGLVKDLVRVGDRLYVAGTFSRVGGKAHGGLVALQARTGALDPFFDVQVAGHHNYTGVAGQSKAAVGVYAFDVAPGGGSLVLIGNFTTVDGWDRDQVALLDLTGGSAAVKTDWRTARYTPACASRAYDFYVRDVDFSPDGSYFVIATTGGPNPGTLCDTAARWETDATGAEVQPTWINDTGGDTLWSVAVTGAAVYVGGHQRWLNNAGGRDFAAAGAVPRPGLGALDPVTGLPLSWNPGRHPRGVGAYPLYATAAGLWVGMDTSYIGKWRYRRPKVAFFPLAGGQPVGPGDAGRLPANVYLGGALPGADDRVLYRVNAGGEALQSADAGPDWAADTATASSYRNSGSTTAISGPVPAVHSSVPAGTPRAVFDSERWDPGAQPEMRWSFPVTAGEQLEVRLYFANRCSCTNAVGKRVFDVTIDGQRRIDDLDIVAAVGHDTGMMRSFLVTSDGSVDMEFLHQVENPLINAIEVQRAGTTTQPADLDSLTRRWYDGAAAGAAQDVPAGGIAWQQVRGAMVVDGDLVYGAADGTLHRRSFDGDAYGPDTVVDPYNDPYWSKVSTGSGTSVYRGVLPAFYGELPDVTAMTYRAGRLYYTRYGRSALYYRSFTPESGIVGGQRYEVPGVALPEVNGLFLSTGELYYADRSDGTLHRLPFAGGAPGGPSTTVSGPALDGTDWRSRAVFLGP